MKMKLRPFSNEEHSAYILEKIRSPKPRKMGILSKIVGLTFEATGLSAPVGSICCVQTDAGKFIKCEVVGFDANKLFLMPLAPSTGLRAGAKVFISSDSDSAVIGENLMGRVVNAVGEPIDGLEPEILGTERSLTSRAINPMDRMPIQRKLDVGVKSINSLLTIGCGQRIGLVAGSGVGKSVLLGMLTKFTKADVVVIGLIGERGREVKEFIETILGNEGLKKSVVVAAPADESPLLRLRATQLAHSYSEYFREMGKDVLLLVDSLSRLAHAQREIGLAIGEPPTTKGYPPSVFSLIPKLIERAGTGKIGQGTVTAIYTLLAEGDDLNDPIVDLARASLDGQVILARALADAAHYPAIDLTGSISRLMPLICSKDEVERANRFRRLWTIYNQSEDLISVGAYEDGSNAELDLAIKMRPQLCSFLQQSMDEEFSFSNTAVALKDCLD